MRISIEMDDRLEDTSVVIHCREVDEDVQGIVDLLKDRKPAASFISGFREDVQHILKPADIVFFQSGKSGVEAVTADGTFKMKEKLYELEEMLCSQHFIRISKSAIANMHEMARFEPSFSGTICVHFKTGGKAYISRNYVASIKEALNMNRRERK